MDKIKPYLLILKKHHFWLLAVLVIFVSAYAWYSGTSAYDAEFAKNNVAITNAFSQADLVRNSQNPPNASFSEALKEFQQKQIQSTLGAWQTMYDQQKGFLVWSRDNDRLSSLKPEEEIPENIRVAYHNYFRDEFPKLFEIVQPLHEDESSKKAEKSAQAAAPGPGQGPKKASLVGIVNWPASEREQIVAQYEWTRGTPTSTQVRLAQEDYWVYRALLEIIAATNQSAGATNRHNAAIKEIQRLAIAQAAASEAAQTQSSILHLPPAQGENKASGKMPTPTSTDADLLAGRYAAPAGGDTVAPPAGAEGAGSSEFKLMPVLMRFRMDERRIPNLLVACANSPLTVDVQMVLYNPGSKSGTAAPAPNAPRNNAQAARQGDVKTEAEWYEATVEVRGVVYIFNPPSKAALGIPEEPAMEPGATPVEQQPGAAAPLAAAPVSQPQENPAAAPANPQQPAPAAPVDGAQPAQPAAPAPATGDPPQAPTAQADGAANQPAPPPAAEAPPAPAQPAEGQPQ